MAGFTRCPKCGVSVKAGNLSQHMAAVHPVIRIRVPVKTLAVVAVGVGLLALVGLGLTAALRQGPAAGATAPDFQLVDTQGKVHALADYKGKVLLIHLMAGTWCPLCQRQNRELQTFASTAKDGVQILNVNMDPSEDERTLETYRQRLGISWPNAKDTAEIWRKYPGITIGKPSTAIHIIDREGKIGKSLFGVQNADQIRQAVQALV